MVDEGRIVLRPAVELSYLNDIEQHDLIESMELADATPSHVQAIKMSDNLEAMKELRDYLAEHHITNVAADTYTKDWNTKTISITAYPETKTESRLIRDYIADSHLKFKVVVQPG